MYNQGLKELAFYAKGSLGGTFCIERHVELRSHAPIEIFTASHNPFLTCKVL